MAPRFRSGWGAYLGTVDQVLAWPQNKLTSFNRAGVLVRVYHDGAKDLLFTLQPRPYGVLIRDFGGHVDTAEHPIHAAVREAKEESLSVLEPWLRMPRLGGAKVYGYMDNLYVLVDVRGVTPGLLRQRFLEAKRRLQGAARPVPVELQETDDLFSVPLIDIEKQLHVERPHRFDDRIMSKNMWRVLQGLVPILR